MKRHFCAASSVKDRAITGQEISTRLSKPCRTLQSDLIAKKIRTLPPLEEKSSAAGAWSGEIQYVSVYLYWGSALLNYKDSGSISTSQTKNTHDWWILTMKLHCRAAAPMTAHALVRRHVRRTGGRRRRRRAEALRNVREARETTRGEKYA